MIGIIGAMSSEIDGLKEKMAPGAVFETISGVEFVKGLIGSTEIVAAIAGVGKVNAAVTAQTMILKYGADAIVNIGVAGSLAPGLEIGDIVVATRVAEHDMDTTPLGDAPGFITGIDRVYMDCDTGISNLIYDAAIELGCKAEKGTIVSGDIFVADDSLKFKLRNLFGAYATEMEGASIGHVCTMNNIPFAVLRSMSDGANGDSVEDFPAFAKKTAKISIDIIVRFLEKLA